MPILERNKNRYPPNWKEISEYIRFVRADNKCEVCGIHNYIVWRIQESTGDFEVYNYFPEDDAEPFNYKDAAALRNRLNDSENFDGNGYFKVVVLTVAHLDHTPENCEYSNLKAMCQKCHNNYDKNHRKETRNEVKNQLKLEI